MSDWLMGDDSGYLGMDDPAMPDAAPAPPSGPATQSSGAGDWIGGTDTVTEDWLGAGSAPAEGHTVGAHVMDGQGDWMMDAGPAQDEPFMTPGTPAYDLDIPAPMALGGDLSVTKPVLAQVQPTRRTLGGTATSATGELSNLVLDVEVQVEVGLGNAALTVEEFLEMGRGSVVELDTPIDAPIELKVRGKLIARGQLVSINGSYGMRIIEMLNEEH